MLAAGTEKFRIKLSPAAGSATAAVSWSSVQEEEDGELDEGRGLHGLCVCFSIVPRGFSLSSHSPLRLIYLRLVEARTRVVCTPRRATAL